MSGEGKEREEKRRESGTPTFREKSMPLTITFKA